MYNLYPLLQRAPVQQPLDHEKTPRCSTICHLEDRFFSFAPRSAYRGDQGSGDTEKRCATKRFEEKKIVALLAALGSRFILINACQAGKQVPGETSSVARSAKIRWQGHHRCVSRFSRFEEELDTEFPNFQQPDQRRHFDGLAGSPPLQLAQDELIPHP